ncbi:copper-binding protein [Desertibaculum subflavum]|uniref:copper-binding protein n=1 Tax=Desertibaculum subflavum TaxID=2268458 RepID=UPI000E6628F1
MLRVLIVAVALFAQAAAALAQAEARGEGEVRKVDASAGKVTLRHGPLEGLDMPAMTMVFRVAEPAMLDRLKVGDRIRFVTAKEGGAFTLKSFEKQE